MHTTPPTTTLPDFLTVLDDIRTALIRVEAFAYAGASVEPPFVSDGEAALAVGRMYVLADATQRAVAAAIALVDGEIARATDIVRAAAPTIKA